MVLVVEHLPSRGKASGGFNSAPKNNRELVSSLLAAGLDDPYIDVLANTLGNGRNASSIQTGLYIHRPAELLNTQDLVHEVPLLLSLHAWPKSQFPGRGPT